MLFNLATDPGESHDLAAERPDTVKQLEGLYQAWRKDKKDPLWPTQELLYTPLQNILDRKQMIPGKKGPGMVEITT